MIGEYGHEIVIGANITLSVTKHGDRVGFVPVFCWDDAEVKRYVEKTAKKELLSFYDNLQDFEESELFSARSIRLYNPDRNQPQPQLKPGEIWEGKISGFFISQKRTQDSRVEVFISVKDLRLQLEWKKFIRENPLEYLLIEQLVSGDAVELETVVAKLTEKTFNFRCGDMAIELTVLVTPDGQFIKRLWKKEYTSREFSDARERDYGSRSQRIILALWEGIPVISRQQFKIYSGFSDNLCPDLIPA